MKKASGFLLAPFCLALLLSIFGQYTHEIGWLEVFAAMLLTPVLLLVAIRIMAERDRLKESEREKEKYEEYERELEREESERKEKEKEKKEDRFTDDEQKKKKMAVSDFHRFYFNIPFFFQSLTFFFLALSFSSPLSPPMRNSSVSPSLSPMART